MACENCDQISDKFKIVKPLPGVPQGRFVVPMVRRNGQPGEMLPGETIPLCFLDLQALATAIDAILNPTPEP